ncbi:MAG: ABC transporter permease [Bacteroidota bacterium]
MSKHPPKWADRFLKWYCDPELLEEIQGDAHELYFERLEQEGKIRADWKYIFDIIRFFRWSNIQKINNGQRPSYLDVFMGLNVKMAWRHATKNKLSFAVKSLTLSISLAFALLLTVFIIQEYSYDKHIPDYERIYRVSTKIEIGDDIINFGGSPEVLAQTLMEEIPEIDNAGWYQDELLNWRSVFEVNENKYTNENAVALTSSLAEILNIPFLIGSSGVLDEPYTIVLTESTARKFFGANEAVGETVYFMGYPLTVAGIVKDPVNTSHFTYDLLISWHGHDGLFCECWDNLTTSTYIKLADGSDINHVKEKIAHVLDDHKLEVLEGTLLSDKELALSPIIENISDIHLGDPLIEDMAIKRDPTNLHLLVAVLLLFYLSCFANYISLSLSDITTGSKKLSVLQVFGGVAASIREVVLSNALVTLLFTLPLVGLFLFLGKDYAHSTLGISLEIGSFISFPFLLILSVLILSAILVFKITVPTLGSTSSILKMLKGRFLENYSGFRVKQVLAGVQLSFSITMIALMFLVVDQFDFINTADKGFEDKDTLVIKVPDGGFPDTKELEESIKKLSGVREVASSSFYTDNITWKNIFNIDTDEGIKKAIVSYEYWGHDFVRLLGLEIIQGRDFDPERKTDLYGAYLINETAAKFFDWENPIRKRISGPMTSRVKREGSIVGIVKDFKTSTLHEKVEPMIFFLGTEEWYTEYLYVKLNPLKPTELIHQIEKEYSNHFTEGPMEWEYLDAQLANLYQEDMQIASIFNVGLWISIFVSCLQIFNMSAFIVLLRAKEMGIRKINGASPHHLFGLHLKSFIKFTFLALITAWPLIYLLSDNWLNNFAYRIDLSLWYFLLPVLITAIIILITSGFHGIKNSRINPIEILNQE